MKKKVLTVILCVLAAVAMLAGITAVEHFRYCPRERDISGNYRNPKYDVMNSEVDYSLYTYSCQFPFGKPPYDTVSSFSNVTHTAVTDNDRAILRGWTILQSKEDYDALLKNAEEIDALNQLDGCLPSEALNLREQTAFHTYDEAFFESHNLLVTDICRYGTRPTSVYPDNVKIHGDTVSMKLRYNWLPTQFNAYMGDLLFIVLPKSCVNADVDFICNDGRGCWLCAIMRAIDRVKHKNDLIPLT